MMSIESARADGWATCDASIEEILEAVGRHAVTVLPTRRGDPMVGVLRPRAPLDAHPNSLSSHYGLEELPPHTDGAHHREPPDLVVLQATQVSRCPTTLWRPAQSNPTAKQRESLNCGVFLVGDGRQSFYSHVLDRDGRARFDPVCMRPVDPLARFASEWIKEQASEAVPHFWSNVGQSLLIDNRQTLHGRSRVPSSEDRELRRVMIRWDSNASL